MMFGMTLDSFNCKESRKATNQGGIHEYAVTKFPFGNILQKSLQRPICRKLTIAIIVQHARDNFSYVVPVRYTRQVAHVGVLPITTHLPLRWQHRAAT